MISKDLESVARPKQLEVGTFRGRGSLAGKQGQIGTAADMVPGAIRRRVVDVRGSSDQAEVLGVTLVVGGRQGMSPGWPVLAYRRPVFHLEWGSGGHHAYAEVDGVDGLVLALPCSDLFIDAENQSTSIDPLRPVPNDEMWLKLGAFVAYGPPVPRPNKVRRTYVLGEQQQGAALIFEVPFFGSDVQVWTTPSVGFDIDFLADTTPTSIGQCPVVGANKGMQAPQDLPNDCTHIMVTLGAGINDGRVVFGLAL